MRDFNNLIDPEAFEELVRNGLPPIEETPANECEECEYWNGTECSAKENRHDYH